MLIAEWSVDGRKGEKDPLPISQQPYTCGYIVVNVYIKRIGPITVIISNTHANNEIVF